MTSSIAKTFEDKLKLDDKAFIVSGRILPQHICLPAGFLHPLSDPDEPKQGQQARAARKGIVHHTSILEAFRDPLLVIDSLSLSDKTLSIRWIKSPDTEVGTFQEIRFLRFVAWVTEFMVDPLTKEAKTVKILEQMKKQDMTDSGYDVGDVFRASLGIEFIGHGLVFLEGLSPVYVASDKLEVKFQFTKVILVPTEA